MQCEMRGVQEAEQEATPTPFFLRWEEKNVTTLLGIASLNMVNGLERVKARLAFQASFACVKYAIYQNAVE